MRLTTKLLQKQSDDVEVLLETEQLSASLPLVSYKFNWFILYFQWWFKIYEQWKVCATGLKNYEITTEVFWEC